MTKNPGIARNQWGLVLRCYLFLSSLLLLFSAFLKIVSVVIPSHLMLMDDPIFGVENRDLALSVSMLEITFAIIIIGKPKRAISFMLLMFLSGSFSLYRVALFIAGFHGYCPCLGDPLDWWPGISKHFSAVSLFILAFLLLSWPIGAFIYGRNNTKSDYMEETAAS